MSRHYQIYKIDKHWMIYDSAQSSGGETTPKKFRSRTAAIRWLAAHTDGGREPFDIEVEEGA